MGKFTVVNEGKLSDTDSSLSNVKSVTETAVSPKTIFNRVGRFVCWVREKHQMPVTSTEREYQMVDELPYGKQAQVDFGEYNMRSPSGSRRKVFSLRLFCRVPASSMYGLQITILPQN